VLLWTLKIGVSVGLFYILFRRIDAAKTWEHMRSASIPWLATALLLYLVVLLISTLRWKILLGTQHVHVPFGRLVNSYLAATFANNFLPSNIGGDVIRVADTARPAQSKTLATAVALADRGVGVVGLGFVAACGSTLAAHQSARIGPIGPSLLWGGLAAAVGASVFALLWPERVGALARPLRIFHAEWVERRILMITSALGRFRKAPGSLAACLAISIAVQALLVGYYASIAAALHVNIPTGHLAMLVPISFLVQMVPFSMNGHGVREATFTAYLTRIGIAEESALALSMIGGALVLLFSMSGVAAYLTRRGKDQAEELRQKAEGLPP
jgi:uncharacterized membrane protein YbhN (UPF0104 family)